MVKITKLFVFMALFSCLTSSVSAAKVDKVLICHFTGSESNPYILILVPQDKAEMHIALHGDKTPDPYFGCETPLPE